jgi:hypothetical protein
MHDSGGKGTTPRIGVTTTAVRWRVRWPTFIVGLDSDALLATVRMLVRPHALALLPPRGVTPSCFETTVSTGQSVVSGRDFRAPMDKVT